MYKNTTPKNSKKYIIISLALFAVLSTMLFTLEKLHITSLFTTKQASTATVSTTLSDTPSVNPTNTVDYGAAKPQDSTTIPDKNTGTQTPAPVNSKLSATITSTRNNSANTSYLIKVAVAGTDSGSCVATMNKGAKILSASSGISLSAGQYSCTDLSIPLSSLDETGTWKLDVTVTDKAGATTSTSKEVIL